jgi:competence protein ComEA
MIRTIVLTLALAALAAAHPAAQSTTAAAPAAGSKAAGPVVNINTATIAELQTLPGIGQKTAARIVEYRDKNGPFKKIEELMNVQGIGEKSFLKLRAQLTVASPRADAQAPQP